MTAERRRTDADGKRRWGHAQLRNGYQLALLLAALLLFVVVLGTAAILGHNAINNEKNEIFEDAWRYRINEGVSTKITLPDSVDLPPGSRIILYNHLPEEIVKGATILVQTSQQNVEVYVGGDVVYTSRNKEAHIASPSSAYHFVRLPNDCAGESIAVGLSSPYKNYAGLMNQVYIGSKASNLFFLLHENGLQFAIGFLVFGVGFLLAIMFLFTREQKNRLAVTDLGAFFACAGYWVMAESSMMQFIFPHPIALTNSSIFALTLMPVFSAFYYFSAHTEMYGGIGKRVVSATALGSAIFAALAIANPMLPIRILPVYLVLLALYLMFLFGIILYRSIKAGNRFSTAVCGILVFGVCGIIEIIAYLGNIKAYHQSKFLTVGLLVLCVFMVVDSVQNFSRVYRAAIKVDTLSVLAYLDSLTGLKNRTAFIEDISSIETGGETAVSIAMYDVNNLKRTNDTKGHLVGDALLHHCAKAITASLRQGDQAYRIGGDEFVAIIRHAPDFDIDSLGGRLRAIIQRENQKKLSYVLSIAYGIATFSQSCDQTLFDTQARADERMYLCKRTQKAEGQTAEMESTNNER